MWTKKTENKTIKGVALENKIGQQKSICADCGSKKSTSKMGKKQKIVFTNYKTWIFIAKTVKNTLSTECTHPKKIGYYIRQKSKSKIKMC